MVGTISSVDPDEGRRRYSGSAYCHFPADVEVDLDDLVGGDDGDERWNRRGQPTLYGCRGLIVPSMAHLDDPSRRNLIAFMDRIPGGVAEIVAGWQEVARIELDAARSQA